MSYRSVFMRVLPHGIGLALGSAGLRSDCDLHHAVLCGPSLAGRRVVADRVRGRCSSARGCCSRTRSRRMAGSGGPRLCRFLARMRWFADARTRAVDGSRARRRRAHGFWIRAGISRAEGWKRSRWCLRPVAARRCPPIRFFSISRWASPGHSPDTSPGNPDMGRLYLFAALCRRACRRIDVFSLPASHQDRRRRGPGCFFLNVSTGQRWHGPAGPCRLLLLPAGPSSGLRNALAFAA